MALPGFTIKSTLPKDLKKYETDQTKFLSMAKIRTMDDSQFVLKFSGEICTAGVGATDFGTGKSKKTSYTIGIEIEENSSTTAMFRQIEGLAKSEIEKYSPNYEYSSLIKDDNKLYIKLKADSQNRSFSCKTNISINPKKYSESNDYDTLSFTGEIQVWFNLDDEKYGISLIAKKLEFLKNSE